MLPTYFATAFPRESKESESWPANLARCKQAWGQGLVALSAIPASDLHLISTGGEQASRFPCPLVETVCAIDGSYLHIHSGSRRRKKKANLAEGAKGTDSRTSASASAAREGFSFRRRSRRGRRTVLLGVGLE